MRTDNPFGNCRKLRGPDFMDSDSSRKEYAGKSRIDKLSCDSGRKRENCYAGRKGGCRRKKQSGGC